MTSAPQNIGRYLLCDEIASGGMATVHLGRVVGPAGFSRTVAIKKMHPHHAREPEFAAMFLDEARLAARIHHPNVIATLDVVAKSGDLFIVMEYVEGETLARLTRAAQAAGERVPQRIALAVLGGALSGLHAAHEATGERREPLSIVHRDVSPQNILVGVDGVTRVLDFGIAKAAARLESTRGGQVKGKLRYMSPEQIRRQPLDRRTDVYAAGVVLWEALAGRRLFSGEDPGAILHEILTSETPPPSLHAPDISPELDAIVLRALAHDPARRFGTAREMAEELERAAPPATARELGSWVETHAASELTQRANRILELESSTLAEIAPEALPPRRRTRADDPTAVEAVPPATPAEPKRSRALFVIAAIVILGGALALIPFLRARANPSDPSAASAASVASAATPAAPSAPEPAPIASEAAPIPSPSAAAAAEKPTKPPSLRSTAKASAKPKPKAGCVPPYVIEADGTKRYKSECL
jgi:serine/threonine-protein kinase